MGWVDPWVGLGWVWVENFCFESVGLGRVSEMADLRKPMCKYVTVIVKQLLCFVKTYSLAHHYIFCI